MKARNKKVIYTIIGIAAFILVTIGITYAYWLITKSQTGENIISSACLDISLTNEENDITLTNQFPISDEEGMKLVPYTFTVTNNCNTNVDYQIALETFDGTDTISSSAIKVMIDSDIPMLLSSSKKLETRIANATNAYLLKYGTLTSKNEESSSSSHSLRIWIDENAPISEMKKTLTSKISVTIGQGIEAPQGSTLSSLILEDAETNNYLYSTTPDFSKVTSAGEYGLYSAQDDYGTSYYFRGDVENNYVKFGKWQEDVILYYGDGVLNYGPFTSYEQCMDDIDNGAPFSFCTEYNFGSNGADMYWRIVRINGDGTIRLVYDGTSAVANSDNHIAIVGLTLYNSSFDDVKYVGYTYDDGSGNQVDSTIKGEVDKWYTNNLEKDYGQYIADSIFCNDRKPTKYVGYSTGIEYTIPPTDEQYFTYYAPYTRLVDNKSPVLICTNQSDRYTVDDITNGNGLLTKPVGLMTADEVSMAGGVFKAANATNYLYSSSRYWTSSPFCFDGGYAEVFEAAVSNLNFVLVNDRGTVGSRPVINLKSDILFSGSGTVSDPYVLAN